MSLKTCWANWLIFVCAVTYTYLFPGIDEYCSLEVVISKLRRLNLGRPSYSVLVSIRLLARIARNQVQNVLLMEPEAYIANTCPSAKLCVSLWLIFDDGDYFKVTLMNQRKVSKVAISMAHRGAYYCRSNRNRLNKSSAVEKSRVRNHASWTHSDWKVYVGHSHYS